MSTIQFIVAGSPPVSFPKIDITLDALPQNIDLKELEASVKLPLAQRVVVQPDRFVIDRYWFVRKTDEALINKSMSRWSDLTRATKRWEQIVVLVTCLFIVVKILIWSRHPQQLRGLIKNIGCGALVGYALVNLLQNRNLFAHVQHEACLTEKDHKREKFLADVFASRRAQAYTQSFDEIYKDAQLCTRILLLEEWEKSYQAYFTKFCKDFLEAKRVCPTPTAQNAWVSDLLNKEVHPFESKIVNCGFFSGTLKEKLEPTRLVFERFRSNTQYSESQLESKRRHFADLHLSLTERIQNTKMKLQGAELLGLYDQEADAVLKKITDAQDLLAKPYAIYYDYTREIVRRAADTFIRNEIDYEGMDALIFGRLPTATLDELSQQIKANFLQKVRQMSDQYDVSKLEASLK